MTDDWTSWAGEPDDLGDPDADTADLGDTGEVAGGAESGLDGDTGSGLGPADAGFDPADPGPDGDAGALGGPDTAGPDTAGLDTGPATAAYDVDPYGADDDTAAGAEDAPDAESGLGPAADPVGADPDADPYADGTWPAPEFPPPLDLAPPEPVDGFPWIDPSTLGEAADAGDPTAGPDAAADPGDLTAYAALEPGTPLSDSDDPATNALARFWELG
jgi:hypothetical protein